MRHKTKFLYVSGNQLDFVWQGWSHPNYFKMILSRIFRKQDMVWFFVYHCKQNGLWNHCCLTVPDSFLRAAQPILRSKLSAFSDFFLHFLLQILYLTKLEFLTFCPRCSPATRLPDSWKSNNLRMSYKSQLCLVWHGWKWPSYFKGVSHVSRRMI